MIAYRLKPILVKVNPWKGDDPDAELMNKWRPGYGEDVCRACGESYNKHGDLESPFGWQIVCPGALIAEAEGFGKFIISQHYLDNFFEKVPDEGVEVSLGMRVRVTFKAASQGGRKSPPGKEYAATVVGRYFAADRHRSAKFCFDDDPSAEKPVEATMRFLAPVDLVYKPIHGVGWKFAICGGPNEVGTGEVIFDRR